MAPPAIPPFDAFNVDLKAHIQAIESEHWRAHTAEHSRDREILEKAAADVRQALEKAAGEVDRRLVDIREVYQNLLGSHLSLHESDKVALQLARQENDRRLIEMSELRVQINNERGLYVARDVLEEKLDTQTTRFETGAGTIRSELRLAVEKVSVEQAAQNRRLNDIEGKFANLDGRFAALAGVLAVAIVIVQFAANQMFK